MEQAKKGKSTGIRSDNYSNIMSYVNLEIGADASVSQNVSMKRPPRHLGVGRVALKTLSLR